MNINHIILQRISKQIDSFGNLIDKNKQTNKLVKDL